MNSLLEKLDLRAVNAGVCSGPNAWIDAGAAPITSYNPATGDAIAEVIPATRDAYGVIVNQAQQAFQSWRRLPAPKRGEIVRDLGNLLREYKEPLGELVSLEMGKIRVEGWGEVQEMIDICDFAVGLSRQLYGLTMHSERPGHRMYEQWHPLGAAGIITAFNFPVAVWAWNAAIAAVCGDTMIWKPSELVPLTAIAAQHLANRVMADHGLTGIFTFAVGANDVGRWMTEDARLPLISFTGSIPTGRRVAQTVAGRLGRTVLELGGNNAIIVSQHADLDLAVRAILFGAVGTAGQRCTTTRRIIAHSSVDRSLCDVLSRPTGRSPSAIRSTQTLMGPLATSQAVEAMFRPCIGP